MEFSKLYSLLVEKEKFVPPEKSDSSDDNAKFDKEADKIARDQSAADVKSDEDDPFRKMGAGAADKLANKIFGTKHSPAAAAKALSIASSKKIAASNIPSWVWTQSIDSDLHGDDRTKAKDALKAEYTAKLKGDDSGDSGDSGDSDNEEPTEEPSEEPSAEEQDDTVSDKIDKLTGDLEDSEEADLDTDELDNLVNDIQDDKKREAKKAEVKKKLADIKKSKKAALDAAKEEEADSEKKDKAKDVKLKA